MTPEAEEHEEREQERPEHRDAIAKVEPPLDPELPEEQRERARQAHPGFAAHFAQAPAREMEEHVLERRAADVHLAVDEALGVDHRQEPRQERPSVRRRDLPDVAASLDTRAETRRESGGVRRGALERELDDARDASDAISSAGVPTRRTCP